MSENIESTENNPEIEELHLFDTDDENFELDDAARNDQFIRLVMMAAGSQLFVNSVALELLKIGQTNWDGLLSAASDALGRLGQCFVLASNPMASSLVFPASSGLLNIFIQRTCYGRG